MPSRHSKRLGEAELEIMQILWSAQAPLTARQILPQLGDRRTWALSTLMTSLYDSRAIGKAELQELRDYLDHLEEDARA